MIQQPDRATRNPEGARDGLELNQNSSKSIALFTDSKITLDSFKNARNHNPIIENIRRALNSLKHRNWTVAISGSRSDIW